MWRKIGLLLVLMLMVTVFVAQNTTSKKSKPKLPQSTAVFNSTTLKAAGPVEQILEFHFNKRFGAPKSCMIQEKMNGGNTLACPIDLDSVSAPGRILDMHGSCSPANSDACRHTAECPGGGICDLHVNRSEPDPNQLVNGKFRRATWYGWTDDGNNATLVIRVFVGK